MKTWIICCLVIVIVLTIYVYGRYDYFKCEDTIQITENLESTKINNDQMAYYFPEDCPGYKEEYFLRDNETDKYYVPQKNRIIVVSKNHTWTKQPTFKYLSKVNEQ